MIEGDIVLGDFVESPTTTTSTTSAPTTSASTTTPAPTTTPATTTAVPTTTKPSNVKSENDGNNDTGSTKAKIPIMAHPKNGQENLTSDLKLETFLEIINKYNQDAAISRGVKLDFKSIEAVEASLNFVKDKKVRINIDYKILCDAIHS